MTISSFIHCNMLCQFKEFIQQKKEGETIILFACLLILLKNKLCFRFCKRNVQKNTKIILEHEINEMNNKFQAVLTML